MMLNSFFSKNGKDKPIRFLFDGETAKKRFTVHDQITVERMQNGVRDTDRLIILMSHFMVNEKNEPVPDKDGYHRLESLSSEDFEKVAIQFTEAFQEAAVPKENGSNSSLPSEAGQTTGVLPDGQLS